MTVNGESIDDAGKTTSDNTGGGVKETPKEDQVVLNVDAYNALLDELDRLEKITQQSVSTAKSLEDLVAEGLEGQPSKKVKGSQDQDLDNLSPQQLAGMIIQHMRDTEIRPLIQKIEELNVRSEIKELTRDGKNPDFFELKDEIHAIASKAPQLSLEEVLILAREQKKTSGVKTDDKSKKDLLRGLPPRRTFGEKPNAVSTTASDTMPSTRKEAAERAFEEMKKAGKI